MGDGGLKFSPENVKAQVGDQLEFHFYPKAHSVSQSSFAAPCTQLEGGFNSGFVPISDDSEAKSSTFTVVVNDTKPIWIYCAQTQHCQNNMSMVVNVSFQSALLNSQFNNKQEPKSANTLSAYRAAAAKTGPSPIGAGAPVGGVLSTGSSANGTTTTTAAGSSSTGTSGGGSGSNATVTAGSPSPTLSGVSTSTGAASTIHVVEWLAAAGAGAVAFGGLLI